MSDNSKDVEVRIAEFWAKNGIYEKAKAGRKGSKKFFFLDGPPYATGSIHVGTAMNKVLKDFYIRFFRMKGFDVWDQPGWDTHGVPIENKVERLLEFKSKNDIEKYGVDKFIVKCKEFATRFIGLMGDQFRNIGVWMDWETPYMTLTNEYIEGAWFTFKKAFEKGYLFQDSYSVHVCPHCETVVAYNEIEYKKVEDTSIYVKFKVRGKDEYVVIWTTTPWTLPSNTGVMANPKADYVRLKAGSDVLIVGKALVEKLMPKFGIDDYEILDTFPGKKLEGLEYEHPLEDIFEFQKNLENAHRVVLSDQFVTLDDGTGLVHTAPGHGQEDYKVGKESGLPIVNPILMNGTFGKGSGKYEGVFAKKADRMIIEELRQRGLLMAEEPIKHDYPMCWRCSSPLLMMAVPQWFFRVTSIREQMIKENKNIKWIPEWAGQRFNNWLENLSDWPISRQRYWGIPLPIWVCGDCKKVKVVGSRKELPEVPDDLHKPHIDKIVFDCECGGNMKRVPDVLDVWFDSGVSSWASLGYPGNSEKFEKMWPADFVLEGPDQIRGWWNSSMINSIMTFGKRPFNSVLFHGFFLDEHGVKMSKSRGNVVTVEDAVDKTGRDVLRFYYLSRPVWDDTYFKLKDLEELSKSFIVVKNTFHFVKTYVPDAPKTKPRSLMPEDKWLLSRLNSVISECTESCESKISNKATESVMNFIMNDFSRWYIKIVRDRVWPEYDGKDKAAAFYTLYTAVRSLACLLAPMCPYLAENVYQDIALKLGSGKESVHLEDWPVADKKMIDADLERDMEFVKQIVEMSNAARQQADIKLRWPVGSVVIVPKSAKGIESAVKELNSVLVRMCNAKSVEVAKSVEGNFAKSESVGFDVFVNTEMDKDLMEDALFRELVRKVQSMRKSGKFQVVDRIALHLSCDDSALKVLEKRKEELMKEVGASTVEFSGACKSYKDVLEFKGVNVHISFDKD